MNKWELFANIVKSLLADEKLFFNHSWALTHVDDLPIGVGGYFSESVLATGAKGLHLQIGHLPQLCRVVSIFPKLDGILFFESNFYPNGLYARLTSPPLNMEVTDFSQETIGLLLREIDNWLDNVETELVASLADIQKVRKNINGQLVRFIASSQ